MRSSWHIYLETSRINSRTNSIIFMIHILSKKLPDFYAICHPTHPGQQRYPWPWLRDRNTCKKAVWIGQFKKIFGIDVSHIKKWTEFKNGKSWLQNNPRKWFYDYWKASILMQWSLTWTLHHMGYDEQKSYISKMKKGAKKEFLNNNPWRQLFEILTPSAAWRCTRFYVFVKKERHTVMSALDWII